MPVCTECKKTFPEGTSNCPDDGSPLVDNLPFQTLEGPDHGTWVEIASLSLEDEARLLQGFLEAEGIPAQIESLKFHMEPVNVGGLAEIRLYVRAEDEERAIELLDKRDEEFESLSEDELNTNEGPAAIDEGEESTGEGESG